MASSQFKPDNLSLRIFRSGGQHLVMPRRNAVVSFPGRILLTLVGWFAVGSFLPPAGAAPNYFIRSWQSEAGLPQNKVTAVVQTHDGYLWVGTYSGLARFDGVRFTIFDENNTPAMWSSRVTSLFEAADGALWIGDESGQVTRYQAGRFQAVPFRAAWSGGKIYDIASDEAGDIWLLNESGQLARVRDGLVLTPEAGTASKLVDMTRSAKGTIWVARDGRVSALEHGQLRPLDLNGTATNNTYVMGIGASRDGGLWVAADGRIRKWKDGKWSEDLGLTPWDTSPVTRWIETQKGVLVAGTADRGLYLLFPDQNEKPLHFDHASGFPSDWVISVCEDREGNLWAGTGGGGLVVLRPNNIQTIAPPDQWQGRVVLSVCPGQDGALWIGTEGAGLYRFQSGVWTNFGSVQGIRNLYIWSLAEDSQGRLWAGSWGGGLFVQNGDRFEFAPGLENITPPMPALLCARAGGLWIGTAMGLLHYQAGSTNWFTENNGQLLRDVRTVAEDRRGAVWFGMAGSGLACLDNQGIRQFRKTDGLSSDFIECLHFDGEGALWIGTFGGGICRFKQGHFAVINREQGLPNSVIGDIEEDGRGFFWMSSHGGIIRASKTELDNCADGKTNAVHCLVYGINDGLPTLECSEGLQPAGCRAPDGRLWFPTSKGLVSVDPQNVKNNPLKPPVLIEGMRVDDRLVAGETNAPPLKIPPGRHRFEFQYTGLSFVAPEKVWFKYRLNGFETEWVDAGDKRVAVYNYIPPGSYTFQVVACNNDGVWNETGASLPFSVLPYFWQALWFRILAWIVIIAASGGLVWFDTRRRMRRKLERLEWQRAVEHERARIAHDIHDDLGAHLTRITMLSESAIGELDNPARATAGLNQIYDTARELTRAMDEIVWAVNPRHDTLESLASYLEKFAQDLLATAGIRCRLDLPLQFPEWRLTAEVRHNLFLAFKEALHNVVKHSTASEVHIRLAPQTASFKLAIEDNGRGFTPGTGGKNQPDDSARIASGNGLENMARRLAEIHGRCDIQSAPGQGTKVIFTVPLKIFAA
jgi:signal transduction histidine kinase/ligand-binding sensor domain-containing protein